MTTATYFAHVHGIVPLLDEVHFRDLWRRGQRCDRPWLALLNMVLVLGALAFVDERSSHMYYLRAQQYLDFELLATGCLESLQALCLLGGLYLHLRNAPNMAYTVMGMAYRIAIGLGLHRMPAAAAGGEDKDRDVSSGGPWRPQVRQRIWWSLFCLDTWGAMNLGRPTLGRWEPRAMTVPRLSAMGDTEDAYSLSLDCASAFCLVATKIQQRLAQPAPMRTDEVLLFDAQVQSWHRSVPSVLLSVEQCPPPLRLAQRISSYRYFNLRLPSVETALLLLGRATPVSRAAERSRLLVQSLLQICTTGSSSGGNAAAAAVTAAAVTAAPAAAAAAAGVDSIPAPIGGMTASPTFTFPAYPALSPNSAAAMPGINHQQHGTHPNTHPGTHSGALPGMDGMTGMPGTMSDEDLWSLLGLDMFTEEASTWGANELGDWPVTDYNHGQFGA